jgi:hypothetical protein
VCGRCAAGLDHGNALAINRRHQNRAWGVRQGALTVEGVKVVSRIRQDLFQAALGNGYAGQLSDGQNRFQERVLHGGFDQAPLKLVGEGSRGQGQRAIERINARCAIAGVAHTVNLHRTEDGL